MISERTKAGLAAAKARGKRFGGLNKAGIARRQDAIARAEALRPFLAEMEGAGMSAGHGDRVEQAQHSDTGRGQVARHAGAPAVGSASEAGDQANGPVLFVAGRARADSTSGSALQPASSARP